VSCTASSGILYEQTFDSDPPEWEATAAGNSPTPAPGLFQGGLVDNGDLVYGTSSTLVNIHAHVLGLNDAGNYVYQGRGKLTDLGGGIGFTILSQYPGSGQFQNVYGRWTRYAAGPAFYYEDHGFPMSCTNGGSTGFAPAANVWFEFELTAEDTGTETILTARFWTQGGARPVDPQVVCTSSAAGRLTTGTVGFWTMQAGSKYLDDVQVLALNGSTPVPCDDGNACTVDSCVDDVCSFVPAADGTTCDDGIGCTAPDACAAGSCVGSDTCPGEESCNPVSGTCELLPECSNGIDDDGDTFADFPADPGCASAADLSEQDPTLPCDDGIDNDGDEKADYPADPACNWPASEREDPECQDGLNNDGTLGIDFDGGAALDLDGDGFIDAAFNPDTPEVGEPDPQCEGKPFRNREAPNCGLGAELAFLLPALWWRRRRRRAAA
jgi:hypothetical protein